MQQLTEGRAGERRRGEVKRRVGENRRLKPTIVEEKKRAKPTISGQLLKIIAKIKYNKKKLNIVRENQRLKPK